MIKKLKIGLGLLVALFGILGLAGSASAQALTYNSDTPVLLATPNYTVTIKSGSAATSVVVSGSSFRVVVPTSSTFTVASNQNMDLTLEAGTGSNSNTCSGTTNTTVITSTADADYTVTPNGGVCAASAGGGGGGGGGGSVAAAPAATYVAPPATVVPVVPDLGCVTGAKFSITTGKACATATVTPATPATPAVPGVSSAAPATPASVSATFSVAKLGTATLKNGSKGNSVKELQKVLNQILKTSLVVDGKLGPKTIATIKTWQKAHGLKADGLVGKLTKAAMIAEANK